MPCRNIRRPHLKNHPDYLCATQLGEVKARGEVAIRSDLAAREHGLNSRQARALDHLLTHGKVTLGDLERLFPDVNRRTLQRDWKALLEKELIAEVGSGNTDPNRYYVQRKLCRAMTWSCDTEL